MQTKWIFIVNDKVTSSDSTESVHLVLLFALEAKQTKQCSYSELWRRKRPVLISRWGKFDNYSSKKSCKKKEKQDIHMFLNSLVIYISSERVTVITSRYITGTCPCCGVQVDWFDWCDLLQKISLHFLGFKLKGATFPVYIQTACWRRTKEARWCDTSDTDVENNNNNNNNSELHVASYARRGGGKTHHLRALLFLFLTFSDTTWDWRRFSASLRAATRPLISLLSACLAARRVAILHAAMQTTNYRPTTSSTTKLTARPLRRLLPPNQLRNTPVVDHWRAGQQHTVERGERRHNY